MNPITEALERMKLVCAVCGREYHRYSTADPEHKFNAVACVNALLHDLKKLQDETREAAQTLRAKFTIARGALEEIKRVGKDPHVTIAKEALERIK